jgi:predicted ATPase
METDNRQSQEAFKDSSYGWEYGKNYAGKVKTYKFGETAGVAVAASKVAIQKEQTNTTQGFAFRTAESFLNSIQKPKENFDKTQYKEGQRVYHKKFGEGIIQMIEQEGDDLKVDIQFD